MGCITMGRVAVGTLFAGLVVVSHAAWAGEPQTEVAITPSHDTWATHDDGLVHGLEATLKVGIEPQACQSTPTYDPCPDAGLVCCPVPGGYSYCSDDGACAATTPSWTAFRKFRSYLRFDLGAVPEGKVVEATLELRAIDKVQNQGGPPKFEAHRLKAIGFDPAICAWDEATLDNTNGTTWSSLPQNTAASPDGTWTFDVTKAVHDWLVDDPDTATVGPEPNCGFMVHDAEFGNGDKALERWVIFHAKEGQASPKLHVTVAHDLDGDGAYSDTDCDEENADIFPGQVESCDQIDNDCDGAVDEENCDAVDNDCDGLIDEGIDLCGPGQACILHTCLKSCQDECTSTFDKTCGPSEAGGWQEYGCGFVDEDPCLDWYPADVCDGDQLCSYGYCAFNCLDDDGCDGFGAKGCEETTPGQWATVTCGEYDGDPCLDWGQVSPCGKGATCTDGACNEDGCLDGCAAPGDKSCQEVGGTFEVLTCWTWTDGNPCLTWGGSESCGPGVACADGVCQGQPPCEQGCDVLYARACDEDGQLVSCGPWDEDPCLEWGDATPCEAGLQCADGACVAAPEPEPEPVPDYGPEPEPEPEPEAAPEPQPEPTADVGQPADVGTDLGATESTGSEDSTSGCACRSAEPPARNALWWLVIFAFLWRRTRRQQRGSPGLKP